MKNMCEEESRYTQLFEVLAFEKWKVAIWGHLTFFFIFSGPNNEFYEFRVFLSEASFIILETHCHDYWDLKEVARLFLEPQGCLEYLENS